MCHVVGSSDSFTNFEFRIYEFVITNICYELFFIRQTERKICFLFQLLKLRRICGQNWRKKLVKTFDELVNGTESQIKSLNHEDFLVS